MPKVQVLEPGYSFSAELGKALGRAGEGFAQGMQKAFSNHLERKDNFEKTLNSVNSSWRQLLKDENLQGYDREKRDEAFNFALALATQKNVPAVLASKAAVDYLENPESYRGIAEQLGVAQPKTPEQKEVKQRIEEPKMSLDERNLLEKQQEKSRVFTPPTKPIAAMTAQEVAQLPTDYVNSLPFQQQVEISKKLGEGAQDAINLAFTKGIDLTGFVAGAERKMQQAGISPFIQKNPFNEGALEIAQGAGEVIKDITLFNLAGGIGGSGALSTAKRAGAGAALFGASEAAKAEFGEGRSPGINEVVQEAATMGTLGVIAEALPALTNLIKRIPGISKSVSTAAKATGIAEEEIVEKAASNLEQRGVSVIKATQGDATTINELQKETNRVAKTFENAEKFNQKELEAIRTETAEKLKESPLEEYYAPKKEVEHHPATIEKENARVKKLEGEKALKMRALLSTRVSVLEGENALRQAKAQGAGADILERIEAKIAADTKQHQKVLNDVRNIEFEIRNKKPPTTTEEINKQIEKSFAELREGIKNPNAEKIEKVRQGIERDKKAIEAAQKLAARGEIPGPEVFDEFIKIHEQYQKAYGDLAKELKDFIRQSKPIKAKANQVKNAEELLKLVEQMQQGIAAKIANHANKRKAMRAIEKPSGAFYRQMLKNLKQDIQAFQKDFFQYGKIHSLNAGKTTQAAQKALPKATEAAKIELKNIEKVAKEANSTVKNPSSENVEKLSKAAGTDKGRTEDTIDALKSEAKEMGAKVDAGKATEKDAKKFAQDILRRYTKLSPTKRVFLNGIVFGTTQALAEEYLGYKPKQQELRFLIGGGAAGGGSVFLPGSQKLKVGIGTGVVSSWVYKTISDAFENKEVENLRKKRNSPAFNRYHKELEERYGKTKANRIRKAAGG